jgi:hypothetical protein
MTYQEKIQQVHKYWSTLTGLSPAPQQRVRFNGKMPEISM